MGYSAGGYSLSPRWYLTWYIYPFFQDWQHWWVLILHKSFDHWSVAVLTVTEHFFYSYFWFFFKLVAFCTEFNLFTLICFVLFIRMDFIYISDHQVGYSPGGYLLYPRWFITWYIYPFFQDWLHRWVLILHKTYDHWSVVVSMVTEHFIYSYFWFFFKLIAFCTEFKLFMLICFVLFMIMDFIHICDHQVGYSARGYSLSQRWFLTWYIYPFSSGRAALMSADIG